MLILTDSRYRNLKNINSLQACRYRTNNKLLWVRLPLKLQLLWGCNRTTVNVLLAAATYSFIKSHETLWCMFQKICEMLYQNNISQNVFFKGWLCKTYEFIFPNSVQNRKYHMLNDSSVVWEVGNESRKKTTFVSDLSIFKEKLFLRGKHSANYRS